MPSPRWRVNGWMGSQWGRGQRVDFFGASGISIPSIYTPMGGWWKSGNSSEHQVGRCPTAGWSVAQGRSFLAHLAQSGWGMHGGGAGVGSPSRYNYSLPYTPLLLALPPQSCCETYYPRPIGTPFLEVDELLFSPKLV